MRGFSTHGSSVLHLINPLNHGRCCGPTYLLYPADSNDQQHIADPPRGPLFCFLSFPQTRPEFDGPPACQSGLPAVTGGVNFRRKTKRRDALVRRSTTACELLCACSRPGRARCRFNGLGTQRGTGSCSCAAANCKPHRLCATVDDGRLAGSTGSSGGHSQLSIMSVIYTVEEVNVCEVGKIPVALSF